MAKRVDVYLVCGGNYHDFDFARLEILKLLAEIPDIRVKVAENYADTAAIEAADFLITYTCDIGPEPEQQQALKRFLESGKRWYALHGTSSLIEWLSRDPLKIGAPKTHPLFMQMLGNQFLAHPPIAEYRVEVSDAEHALVSGIEPFDTTDELYLMEYHGAIQPLLHTHYSGHLPEFEEGDWRERDDKHMVMYLHEFGAGEVLYLTLGHCRSTHDMQPLMDTWPSIDRCSWELPVYYDLLRRGIRWGARLDEFQDPPND
ncbi:MAG: ThuA domain-containing protein [Pseudomonadota bacterium]